MKQKDEHMENIYENLFNMLYKWSVVYNNQLREASLVAIPPGCWKSYCYIWEAVTRRRLEKMFSEMISKNSREKIIRAFFFNKTANQDLQVY